MIMADISPVIRFNPDEESRAAATVMFTNEVLASGNCCYEILFFDL